ncbi:hypothetical protein FKM82_024043 [Ascaphus truei]
MDVMKGTFDSLPTPSAPPPPEEFVYNYAVEEDNMTTPSRPRQETTRRPRQEESFLPDNLPSSAATTHPLTEEHPLPEPNLHMLASIRCPTSSCASCNRHTGKSIG